jgi:hypothetical protein
MPVCGVRMDNHPDLFIEEFSPGLSWLLIAKNVIEMRGENHRVDSVSGRESFRLTSRVIDSATEQVEGRC